MLILDIETVADDQLPINARNWFLEKKTDSRLTNPEKIEANQQEIAKKMGLSPLTGKVAFVGMLSSFPRDGYVETNIFSNVEDIESPALQDTVYIRSVGLDGSSEYDILTTVWKDITEEIINSGRIVTFNGKEFDLPFLLKRSIIKGIPKDPSLPTFDRINNKYNTSLHIDIYGVFNTSYRDYWGPGTQSEWGYLIKAQTSLSSDGNKIQDMYDAGDFEGIKNKCIGDLAVLYYLYQRVKGWA